MKPKRYLSFLIGLIVFGGAPSWAISPDQFINELKDKSPQLDGMSLRNYRLEDLNHDGQLEVLEVVNPIEEASTGLLNVKLSPAFEWVNIYQKKGNEYVLATEQFGAFLKSRKIFYVSWLKRFDEPELLDTDSQKLLRANAQQFRETLTDYVARIDHILASERPNKSLEPTNPAQGAR